MTPPGCDQFRAARPSRRAILEAGAVSFAGLGLPGLLRADTSTAANPTGAGFGRAKSCILVFAWGGPSHLDTWDPKPDAPADIRGEFQPIATRTPGLFITEHFPQLAQQTHRLAVVRSMTHDDPAHLSTVHLLQTGHLAPKPNSDADGPSTKDWPHLGAFVAKLMPTSGALPPAVTMPWIVSHPAAPGGKAPGQHGGWLGKAYDPFLLDGDPSAPGFQVTGMQLPEGMSYERLASRRGLLGTTGAEWDPARLSSWDSFQGRAIGALESAQARGAFEVAREDPRLRDRYGRNIHGQCLLLARRLVESGVRLVTVNWHDDGQAFWDTHGNNFPSLKNRLMPPTDQGLSALLDDLSARGLLDETLIVWIGEFGRNPKINRANAGREHWPRCYSAVLAGAGVQGGVIYGASDRIGAYPANNPTSPEDIAATILHALGVAPSTEVADAVGRPLRVCDGAPLTALFG